MKSPTAISALNSSYRTQERLASKNHNQRNQYIKPSQQTPQTTEPGEPNSGRRLGLWMAVATLGIVATVLLVTSISTQWQIGICIAGAWMATIIFNVYSLNYLAGQAILPKAMPRK